MVAASKDRVNTTIKAPDLLPYPVATTTIYKGTMVCLNASGYAVPAADTNGYSNVIGIAYEQVVNTGAPGAKTIRVQSNVVADLTATSITQAMVGTEMFVAFDNEFDNTSAQGIRAGILQEYISATRGKLLIREPAINPASIGTADITNGNITAPKLSATLIKGFIPLPLAGWRLIAAADVADSAANGGVLAKDSDPIFERTNVGTDPQLRIHWAKTSVIPITNEFMYPPDLDDASAIEVHILAYKDGNVNGAAQIGVSFFEGLGDANAGGNLNAALTELTPTEKYVTIAAGDVGAHPKSATITITPGAHADDAEYITATWIEYTRK